MKKEIIIIAAALSLSACAANQPNESAAMEDSSTNTAAMKRMANKPISSATIRIQNITPYSKDNAIAGNIKTECKLNQQLPDFIESFADKNDMHVVKRANLNKKTKGKVLLVEITGALSMGNAFLGHRKSTEIRGTLYNNGKRVSSFTGRRVSGGGVFGGFKGSCSVLGRTVKALGQDVAHWLKSPVDRAHLGD